MNSVFPTWEAATITILETRGSVKARIGSSRYGVRAVRHCPASAAFSVDNTRYLSAHSETEISSGGAKCLTIDANKASSLLAAVSSIVRRIFSTFPALPLTDALFVCFCVIFIV